MDEDRREEPRGRPEGSGGGGNNPGNNLHVSGLSSRVEDRDLEDVFGKYGRIQKAAVMKDPHTGEARGFAFVTMETAEEADAAMTGLNATELLGRVMTVAKARRGRARTPTPGAYHGPPKRDEPTSRYGGGGGRDYGGRGGYDDRRRDDRRYDDRYDDRRGGGYDDRRGGGGYDDRRDYRRDDYSRSYAQPMRGDDRSYDRRY